MQETAIARNEALLNTIDPAKMEASKQALQLMRGQAAASLKPYQDQRTTAREQLVGQLRNQMGPGAESSSAGLNALNQFDQATASQTASLQQSSMNNLMGIANATGPSEFAGADELQKNLIQLQSQQKLMMQAQKDTPLTPYAGAQFAGSAMMGGVLSNLGASGGANIAGQFIGNQVKGLFGGSGSNGSGNPYSANNGMSPEGFDYSNIDPNTGAGAGNGVYGPSIDPGSAGGSLDGTIGDLGAGGYGM